MDAKPKINITCQQATYLSSKKEEGKLSFVLRLQLYLHLFSCPPCRKFFAQSKEMIVQIKRMYNSDKQVHTLSDEVKEHIQDQINKAKSDL